MRLHRNLIAATLAAAFMFGVNVLARAADVHQHGAGRATALKLDHGKKWATDEPLRRNMAEIRAALSAKHAGIHRGTLAIAEYQALGTLVETRVASIVAECKLQPAADANLHLVVARLVAGADALQGKSTLTPAKGAVEIVKAVNEYGRFFNHPGWKPLS